MSTEPIAVPASTPARAGSRGFALPTVLFGLVLMGFLATGSFFVARQDSRSTVAGEHSGTAVYLAEQGINEVLLDWDGASFASMTVGQTATFTGVEDAGKWSVIALKTDASNYFLRSTATVTEGGDMGSGATRSVGMLTRVIPPDMEMRAAVSTVGTLKVRGSATVSGMDADPPGWSGDCGITPKDNKPGLLIDDFANIDAQGSYEVYGDPYLQEDKSLTSTDLLTYGDMDFDQLAAMASKVYPTTTTVTNTAPDSVDVGGGTYVCRKGTLGNWGDPTNPGSACYDYFPIIYAKQDLSLSSSSNGQGILLIEGSLTIQGGFNFYGIILAKGTVRTAGSGGTIRGGVNAANVEVDASTLTGNAEIYYSSCAADRAVLNSTLSTPMPLAERSWVDLSGTSY